MIFLYMIQLLTIAWIIYLKSCKGVQMWILNWEKCHFMVHDAVILGHIISNRGIKVDKAKIEVIKKLPPPSSIKSIRSFLRYVSFYRRLTKDFSKITKSLTHLLVKDVLFELNEECLSAFHRLKEALISAPIIQALDWVTFWGYARCQWLCSGSSFGTKERQ